MSTPDMPPSDINLKDFGRMEAKVELMEQRIEKMAAQMDDLMALANRSRGGFWVGMSIASVLGAVATFIVDRIFK